MPAKTLKSVLTRKKLLQLAGEKFFTRGEDYYQRDYVEPVFYSGDILIAKVWGTYFLILWK